MVNLQNRIHPQRILWLEYQIRHITASALLIDWIYAQPIYISSNVKNYDIIREVWFVYL